MDISPRLVRFEDRRDPDPVASYLKSIVPVCPFIEPSEKAGRLYASQMTLDCLTADEIHPRMFEAILPAVEGFRKQRAALVEKTDRLLLCHTMIFRFPRAFDAQANRLMGWPNWLGYLVKELYTPKAIVFGFVRKGLSERSSTGEAIPASPFHAVVIRSKVVGSDQRFFAGNKAFLSAFAAAVDDGGDAHAGMLPSVPNIRDPLAIRADNYFHRLRVRAQEAMRGRPQG